jgi:hypothetical protein
VVPDLAAPEILRQPAAAPTDAEGRSGSKAGAASLAKTLENPDVPGEDGDGHPHECLTQKRGCEARLPWAMVESAQAVSSAKVAPSCRVEEVGDAKTLSLQDTLESRDKEPERPGIQGVAASDADTSRPVSGPVCTTVAQVRAALAHAGRVGHQGVVVWGRCARCGRVGRVVHFDGVLRARARAP